MRTQFVGQSNRVGCCEPPLLIEPGTGGLLVRPVNADGSAAPSGSAADPVATTGLAYISTHAQTRPNNATPYNPLDVVGTDPATVMEFTNIGPEGGSILLTSALLRIDVGSVPAGMGNQRLHLYSAAPAAIADNAAHNVPAGDRAIYLGWINLGTPVGVGDTIVAQADQLSKVVRLAEGSTSLFGLRQATLGYTPTAEAVSTITLHAVAL